MSLSNTNSGIIPDVEFDTPANRIIAQQSPKNKFGIQLLPDITFLRQLSIQGRLRYDTAANATVTITPSVGETQFFYKVYLTATSAFSQFTITNAGNTRAILRLDTTTSFELDLFDSLVGNDTDSFTVVPSGAATAITVLSWVENTSRIRDVTT